MVPETYMAFEGVKDTYELACVVEYLVLLGEKKYAGKELDLTREY